ncbi:MAG: hypothetical protein IJX26_01985 [Clostridia bacterium]|nr:hypothetical protein [Clostridia bacterium]
MELSKNVKLISLYELYGKSLTEKQQQVFDLCVLQDLSLSEVSDLLNITRQAVKFSLDNSISLLEKLESQLQILSKFDRIKEKLNQLKNTDDEDLKLKINKILEEI